MLIEKTDRCKGSICFHNKDVLPIRCVTEGDALLCKTVIDLIFHLINYDDRIRRYSALDLKKSGNQGMTTSIPVVIYAEEMGIDEEKKYRALVLANLTTIHQKTLIGRLSAYCGAVSAGAGAGAGIAYLCGGGLKEIEHTVVNALAIVSGIVCDGAKASCARRLQWQ